MKTHRISQTIEKSLWKAMLTTVCSIFLVGAAYAQGGPCAVSQVRFRIGAASELVGVLNIEIHFANGTIQSAPNVNQSTTWAANKAYVVKIPLKQTVPVSEIKRIRLIYYPSPGVNEWAMSFLRARASGSGVDVRIAAWGQAPPALNPSPHQFSVTSPSTYAAFGIYTAIPANACDFARRPVEGPVRLAPGVAVEGAARNSGPLLPTSPQQGMLANQSSPALLQGAAPANGVTEVTANRAALTAPAIMQKTSPGTIGPSQTMSAQGNVGSPVGRQGTTVPLAPATMSQLNRPNKMRMAGGTLTGGIFWEALRVAYNPSVPCQGLQVALSATTAAGLQSLATTNQFLFTQSARRPGNQLCSYSFHRVPEGVALQVQVSISQPFASQAAVIGPFGAPNSPIKIPGGQCNNSSSGTALSLESGWQICGERAYNVNFQLVPRSAAGGSGAGTNPSLQPLLPHGGSNTSSGGTGLMSLKPLTPRGSSNGGSNTASASGSEKPLTNADVLKLLRRGISEQDILTTIRNHPATFDVSNQARASFDRECAAIKKAANVSTGTWATEIGDVWNAMKNVVICQETNGRGGEGACDLSPLQSSPKNTSAAPTPVPSKGHGRTEYEPMTVERGVTHDTGFANWANSAQALDKGSPSTSKAKPAMNVGGTLGPSQTMSAQENASSATTITQPARTVAVAVAVASQATTSGSAPRSANLMAMGQVPSQVNLQVASACAKDPSFRILSISGIPDGKTMTLNHQYTIWGCSFGNPPLAKRPTPPVTSPSQNQAEVRPTNYAAAIYMSPAPSHIAMFIYADIQSWSDNSIIVAFPTSAAQFHSVSLSSLDFPAVAQLWVTRGEQQTTIYPPESGALMFKPAN